MLLDVVPSDVFRVKGLRVCGVGRFGFKNAMSKVQSTSNGNRTAGRHVRFPDFEP